MKIKQKINYSQSKILSILPQFCNFVQLRFHKIFRSMKIYDESFTRPEGSSIKNFAFSLKVTYKYSIHVSLTALMFLMSWDVHAPSTSIFAEKKIHRPTSA